MSLSKLLNCPMKLRCDEDWDDMTVVDDATRHCGKCDTDVHRVANINDLKSAVLNDWCIYVTVETNRPLRLTGIPSSQSEQMKKFFDSLGD